MSLENSCNRLSGSKTVKPAVWADDLPSVWLHLLPGVDSNTHIIQCWLPACCNRSPIAGHLIKLAESSFSRCPPIISSPATLYMTSSGNPRVHLSQSLCLTVPKFSSDTTELHVLMWPDQWSLNGNSVSDSYWIWPLAHFTAHQWRPSVLLHSLYVCGAGRQRCTVSPLSHLLSLLFIDPNHTGGIYLSIVCVFVCMENVCVCAQGGLSMSMYVGMCVCQRHASAAARLPQPPCWLFHWWQNASCPPPPAPHPKKTDDAVAPKSLL